MALPATSSGRHSLFPGEQARSQREEACQACRQTARVAEAQTLSINRPHVAQILAAMSKGHRRSSELEEIKTGQGIHHVEVFWQILPRRVDEGGLGFS